MDVWLSCCRFLITGAVLVLVGGLVIVTNLLKISYCCMIVVLGGYSIIRGWKKLSAGYLGGGFWGFWVVVLLCRCCLESYDTGKFPIALVGTKNLWWGLKV